MAGKRTAKRITVEQPEVPPVSKKARTRRLRSDDLLWQEAEVDDDHTQSKVSIKPDSAEVRPTEPVNPTKKVCNRRRSLRVEKLPQPPQSDASITLKQVRDRSNRRVDEPSPISAAQNRKIKAKRSDTQPEVRPAEHITPEMKVRDRRRSKAKLDGSLTSPEPIIVDEPHAVSQPKVARNRRKRRVEEQEEEVGGGRMQSDASIPAKQVCDKCNRPPLEQVRDFRNRQVNDKSPTSATQKKLSPPESEVEVVSTPKKSKNARYCRSRRVDKPLKQSDEQIIDGNTKLKALFPMKRTLEPSPNPGVMKSKTKSKITQPNKGVNEPEEKVHGTRPHPEEIAKKTRKCRRPREVEPSPPPATQDSDVEIIEIDTDPGVSSPEDSDRRSQRRKVEPHAVQDSDVEIVESDTEPEMVEEPLAGRISGADQDSTCVIIEEPVECIDVEEEMEKHDMIEEILNHMCQQFGIERPKREDKLAKIKVEKD